MNIDSRSATRVTPELRARKLQHVVQLIQLSSATFLFFSLLFFSRYRRCATATNTAKQRLQGVDASLTPFLVHRESTPSSSPISHAPINTFARFPIHRGSPPTEYLSNTFQNTSRAVRTIVTMASRPNKIRPIRRVRRHGQPTVALLELPKRVSHSDCHSQ